MQLEYIQFGFTVPTKLSWFLVYKWLMISVNAIIGFFYKKNTYDCNYMYNYIHMYIYYQKKYLFVKTNIIIFRFYVLRNHKNLKIQRVQNPENN